MKNNKKVFLFSLFVFFCLIKPTYAETKQAVLQDAVNIRKGPGTNYEVLSLGKTGSSYSLKKETVVADEPKNGTCNAGWYEIEYEKSSGYVCANHVQIKMPGENLDLYDRPWTTPKKAIIGGARFITKSYINKGQNTSYLKKFNVSPTSAYSKYNHQYMANLAAPSSEAYSSYISYSKNDLLSLPLEFTIPIYENMPDYTALPGTRATACTSKVTDAEFETKLTSEGFPETYKCKLRILHETYPNWTFKALKTGLDFNKAVNAEQNVSSIQGGDKYYDLSSGKRIQTERGWYRANKETVGYYLDPRNFLIPERILMFENLAYSDKYTEKAVQSILEGTFMSGTSELDKQSYASIFVEAGKQENISAVYLASLAKQEAGSKVTNTTSGAEFTYKETTYKGLYNFFNIGASSSEENPALAGLVWASGGSNAVIVIPGSSSTTKPVESKPIPEKPTTNTTTQNGTTTNDKPVAQIDDSEETLLKKLGVKLTNDCIENLTVGTTIGKIRSTMTGYTISTTMQDTDIIKTGAKITIGIGSKNYTYTFIVPGDIDGDGKLGATDYVKIKNYIMEKSGSSLNVAQSLAADVDKNGQIGATDYVKIKNSIMER